MTKATTVLAVIAAACVVHARPALAQAPPAGARFLNISVGAQPQQREIRTSENPIIYDEPATVTSVHAIDNGPMFDVTAGYQVGEQFAVAVGVSYFTDSGSSALVAAIPDPIFTDRPRTATAATDDLKHTELGIHLQAVWEVPVSERIRVAFSAGPSIFRVSQELTATVTVADRTQNITAVKSSNDGTGIGLNAGVDGRYMFTPQLGVGLFIRYAGASVDLPAVEDLSVGGFQTGLGLRIRF